MLRTRPHPHRAATPGIRCNDSVPATMGTTLATGARPSDAPSSPPPEPPTSTGGIKGTDEDETHGFAERMGIGGRVDREISTDVTAVAALGNSQFSDEGQGRLRLVSQ